MTKNYLPYFIRPNSPCVLATWLKNWHLRTVVSVKKDLKRRKLFSLTLVHIFYVLNAQENYIDYGGMRERRRKNVHVVGCCCCKIYLPILTLLTCPPIPKHHYLLGYLSLFIFKKTMKMTFFQL